MRIIGIDVSHWEGVIDWATVKPWIGFAYYKCTDGITGVDPQFYANREGTAQNGIPSAPFHYYQPDLDPLKQANHFTDVAGKNYKRYILDIEKTATVTPNTTIYQYRATYWTRLKVTINQLLAITGTYPVIYTGAYFWNENIGNRPDAAKCDLILARYCYAKNPLPPMPWAQRGPKVWQFTDYGFVPGVVTEVDMDWFYGTLPECKTYFGGN